MLSAMNIAWGQPDAHGWTCPRVERLSILATPDTQSYRLHCQGKKHRAGISPVVKGRQLPMTRFFNTLSQGSQPSQLPSQESSRPLEDPSSPHSGAFSGTQKHVLALCSVGGQIAWFGGARTHTCCPEFRIRYRERDPHAL